MNLSRKSLLDKGILENGFRHPWLKSTCPPRRVQESVLGMLKERYFKALGIDKAKKLIPGYDFPRQFLDEAALSAGEIFKVLSDTEKQVCTNELSTVMTTLLADAFAKGNKEMRERDQVPSWIIQGKPRLSLRGVHLTFGPFPPPDGYVMQHWWSIMSLVVPKEDSEFISHLQQKKVLKEAQEEGIYMRINVRMMNNVEFKVLSKGEEVFRDTRSFVDLEFMSPHFNPWDELHYLDSEGEWNLKWKWKLSDIDFLLQSQMKQMESLFLECLEYKEACATTNSDGVLHQDIKDIITVELKKSDFLNSSQTLDRTLTFKKSLDEIASSFSKQHIDHDAILVEKINLSKSNSRTHYTTKRSSTQNELPAIKIQGSVIQALGSSEETDVVVTDMVFPPFSFQKTFDWQRPRSKSLEPEVIEDFYPINMESSDIFNESGNSSKGLLGFGRTAVTSSNESEILTISSKTLPVERPEFPDSRNTSFNSSLPAAGAHKQINKSISGYAKRLPTSAVQSTAGLTLLQTAAVSQGIITPQKSDDSKKNHSRNNTALSAYEITPSAASSSKLFKLDDFEVIRKVGKGGFARVFLVQQKKSNRKYYALKCIRKADIIRLKQERQIMNEKNILKKFKHNFIVDLFHTFQTQNFLFMTMEFVPGGDLYTLMKKYKGFTEEVAKFYAAEVLIAIEYLHSIRIVYRDLKPENILLDATGHVKLADFGFARILNGKTKSFCGTPDYIAWEIVANKEYTHSVDWWSLGVLIFELVAGKTPFRAKTSELIYENVADLNIQWTTSIFGLCKDLIQKLLVSNPAFRLGHRLGSPEIKMHMWFSSLNWKKIGMRQVLPPIIPNVNVPEVQAGTIPAQDPNTEFEEFLNDSNHEFEKKEVNPSSSQSDPFKDF